MAYVTPLGWLNDDPQNCIRASMEVGPSAPVTDVAGLSPVAAQKLRLIYNISTIGALEDYIIYNGYPAAVEFCEESRFILSLRVARKLKFMQ